jgi:hypothetical protein
LASVVMIAKVRIHSPEVAVCAENVIRFDLVTESLNVSRDGRTATLLSELAGFAVQAEEPT